MVAEYTFIGEFDLLRIARTDIRVEKWTQQPYREAVMKFYKLYRAREEVQRLNIEIRRLRTFIVEEKKHTEGVLEQLSADEPLLADELRRRWTLRSSVNVHHIQRLNRLEHETYYSGSQSDRTGCQGVFDIDGIALAREDQLHEENEQDNDFEAIAEFVASIDDSD